MFLTAQCVGVRWADPSSPCSLLLVGQGKMFWVAIACSLWTCLHVSLHFTSQLPSSLDLPVPRDSNDFSQVRADYSPHLFESVLLNGTCLHLSIT